MTITEAIAERTTCPCGVCEAKRLLAHEIERIRGLIPAAKEAREVAAAFFRVLTPNQIDMVLAELSTLGIKPAFGTRLQDAIKAAEAAGGET